MIKTYTEAVLFLAARLKKKDLSDMSAKVDAQVAASKMPLEDFLRAIEMYCDSGAEFYPNNIQKVLDLVLKPISNEDKSQQISAILIKAVIDYGTDWTSGTYQTYDTDKGEVFGCTYRGLMSGKKHFYLNWDHAAVSVFGVEGLTVVNRYGGWTRFCELVNESPDGVIRQQTSRLATSLLNTRERTGSFDIPQISSGPSVGLQSTAKIIELSNIKEISKE